MVRRWTLVDFAVLGLSGAVVGQATPASTADRLAAIEAAYWDLPLNMLRVDALDRVYPDRPPEPAAYKQPVSVPRGGTVAFQFALMARERGYAVLKVSPFFGAQGRVLETQARLYEVSAVPVEANNNGGSQTRVGVKPPAEWMEHLVREAPFEVAEVLAETDAVELAAGRYHAVLIDVAVPADAVPGLYTGSVQGKTIGHAVDVPFAFEVHATVAPARPALSTTHWFWPEPENVSYGDPPAWWSDAHWRLIENSGRVLHAFGQDTILTPILDGRHPLIQTVRKPDGAYAFDFTRFDQWVATFLRLGFETFEGRHVGGVPPMRSTGGVWVLDEATGDVTQPFADAKDPEPWLAFLPTFYQALYTHLQTNGLTGRYVQCQLDEPRDPEQYKRLAGIARTYLPGIKTKDAINSRPRDFSPLVDIHVFALTTLEQNADLARERRANGQSVWLYHCCSPYPPYPNRHLDERLANSRLYPWLAYLLGADGYLYWGANIYRGADPYKTSIGPVPNGSQDPGHPPGDNWMFYPTKDGLVPGLRMVAFRDGLLDHALLTLLAENDKAQADEIMATIARSLTDYAQDPGAYHRARKQLLQTLDQLVPAK